MASIKKWLNPVSDPLEKEREKGFLSTGLSQFGHLCLEPAERNSLVSMTRSCLHNPHTSFPFGEMGYH